MSKQGIRHPAVVDLVTSKDDCCYLYIVQVDPLSARDLPLLQEKINYYLAFALDGQLLNTYPEMAGKRVAIRLQIPTDPGELHETFFQRVKQICREEGIDFVVEIPDFLRQLNQLFPPENTESRSAIRPWFKFWPQ